MRRASCWTDKLEEYHEPDAILTTLARPSRVRRAQVKFYRYWLYPILNGDAPRDHITKRAGVRVLSLLMDLQRLEQISASLRPLMREREKARRDNEFELIDQLFNRRARVVARKAGHVISLTDESSYNWPGFRFSDPTAERLNRDGRKLLEQVSARLRRYRWYTRLWVNFDFGLDQESSWDDGPASFYHENVAVSTFLKHLGAGTLHRFRRCVTCCSWFYAITNHQVHCKTACRKRSYSQSEERKLEHAQYMRGYRSREKESEGRAADRAMIVKGR
jgi:hypothetical protein